MNSDLYYDVFGEAYARLNAMKETMNEQDTHFVSDKRECGLLHKTDPSLPFLRLECSLYNGYESSPLLESKLLIAPLPGGMFDPPLTSLSFVAPSFSSTPKD